MVDKASQKPLPFSLIALATIFSANTIPTKRSNNLEPDELADELVFKRKMEINCQYQQKKIVSACNNCPPSDLLAISIYLK